MGQAVASAPSSRNRRCGARAARDANTYEHRRPEQSALHLVVRETLLTLFADIEQGFASRLPELVRSELEEEHSLRTIVVESFPS